jgi:hypothetical protein
VQAAVAGGAKTVIVDSMSHEHEGPGGHLDFHDQEVKRLLEAGGFKSEFAAQIPAWTRPAGRRRRMYNGLLQDPLNFNFCFRAQEKIKLVKKGGKTEPVELGWQAIAGEEFVYEMTDRFLLVPGCQGRPSFTEEAWATGVPKMPDEHREFFPAGAQLSEDIGVMLAQWALGTPGPLGDDVVQAFAAIGVTPRQITEHLGREATAHDTKALKQWYRELKAKPPAAKPADTPPPHQEPAGATNATPARPRYSTFADAVLKAPDRDTAKLAIAEAHAAGIPDDQLKDLGKLADERWPRED